MARKAVFEGLVFDEKENVLPVAYVGGEACYVLDDDGFLRHIPSEQVDHQVLDVMREQIKENKDIISKQATYMLGRDDIFTHAIINQQLDHVDEHLNLLMDQGLPESGRAFLGMLGFRIFVNHHGEVIRVEQPVAPGGEDE